MEVREDADWQDGTRNWYAEAEGITSARNPLQLAAVSAGADDLPFTSPSSVTFSCSYSHVHSPLVPSLAQNDVPTLF